VQWGAKRPVRGPGYQLKRSKHTVLGILIENMHRFSDFRRTENLKWETTGGGQRSGQEGTTAHYLSQKLVIETN